MSNFSKILILGSVSVSVFCFCSRVKPSNVGLVYNFSKLQDYTYGNGLHISIPLVHSIESMDCSVSKIDIDTHSGTKDLQTVNIKSVVGLQIDPKSSVTVVREFKSRENAINQFKSEIMEILNSTISKYSAEEILSRRSKIKDDVDALIKSRAALYHIRVLNISLQDIKYSEEYYNSIERKQVAEQKAKQAYYEAQEAKQVADKIVTLAKAESDSQKILINSTTDKILELKAIEKWDGHLPTSLGSSAVPFLNIKSK